MKHHRFENALYTFAFCLSQCIRVFKAKLRRCCFWGLEDALQDQGVHQDRLGTDTVSHNMINNLSWRDIMSHYELWSCVYLISRWARRQSAVHLICNSVLRQHSNPKRAAASSWGRLHLNARFWHAMFNVHLRPGSAAVRITKIMHATTPITHLYTLSLSPSASSHNTHVLQLSCCLPSQNTQEDPVSVTSSCQCN